MLDKLEKKPTRAEAEKKAEAWKTLNSVLVQENARFMSSLRKMLTEKEGKLEELKVKLEGKTGSEQENAEYLYLGGYTQALKDILGIKNG